ncbi:MAG: filamentous hemagglutinin N-terminal domain-containing protein, partial [Selenomonadaceae bacterium]
MKWIEKLHKKALTAAVCLALSASTAFAMPSGGNVISGGVDGIVDGTVASGGTLTVTGGNSVINWDAFGILSGETLNVNTAGGALLNRVTGAGVSELMGILNQTGANQMLIINPNGIVVGNGAQINATNLVLSTLDVADGYSFTGSKNNVIGSFVTPSGKEKAAVKINGGTIKVGDAFKVFGGTIEIADGVQIAPATSVSDINDIKANTNMFAANSVTISSERSEFDADPSNTLSFEGVAAGTNLYLNGGKIDIFGGKPNEGRDGEGDLGKFRVVAGNQFKEGLVYATPENKVTIGKADGSNNVNICAKSVVVMGGSVDLNRNTDLWGTDNVTVLAGNRIKHSPKADGTNAVESANSDNEINITFTTLQYEPHEEITGDGIVAVRGGSVNMKEAWIYAPTAWITGTTSSGTKSDNNTTANKVTMDLASVSSITAKLRCDKLYS